MKIDKDKLFSSKIWKSTLKPNPLIVAEYTQEEVYKAHLFKINCSSPVITRIRLYCKGFFLEYAAYAKDYENMREYFFRKMLKIRENTE